MQTSVSLETIPAQRPGVSIRDEAEGDNRYLVYEPDREAIFLMNGIAKTIFDLCDGTRDNRAIAERLSAEYEIPAEVDAGACVCNYVSILAYAQLVDLL